MTTVEKTVGILGATSLVGEFLLPLLIKASWDVKAFSRQAIQQTHAGIEWHQLASKPEVEITDFKESMQDGKGAIPFWICVAPIWILPEYFGFLKEKGARRIVTLSSTSRYTKDNSSDPKEQLIARRLADNESRLKEWAKKNDVEWVILRPTLIYGGGRDKNICEIARFIRRFGFFPILGKASGLRQPVHAEDVASACFAALTSDASSMREYNISGGETLAYREMVKCIFIALEKKPRLLVVPLLVFRIAVSCLKPIPRYSHWSAAMADRMNQDLTFDHQEATQDFGYMPRDFNLDVSDLPE